MGAGTGAWGGVVVVVQGGAVRALPAAAVVDLAAVAVTLEASGLEATATPEPPPVVAATLHLRHPVRVSRLAGRFLRSRLDGTSTTLVLESRVQPGPGAGAGLQSVAPIPVREVGVGATFDLVVPVGEPDRLRYASPLLTLVVPTAVPPATAARMLVDHRAFAGGTHCAGDAALVRMAGGEATPVSADDLRAALEVHEAAVVVEMLRDVVRSPS